MVPEQQKLNKEYWEEYVEIQPKNNATKKEKNELKEFNKKRKEEWKHELPSVLESLKLNLDLLFELSKVLNIDENEKKIVDNMLHKNGENLFIQKPIDNCYRFNLSETSNNINYADYIEYFDNNTFSMPISIISKYSKFEATYSNQNTSKTYDFWECKQVVRKDDEVFVTIGKVDFKIDKDTKLQIDFNPIGDTDSKVYTTKFVNDGLWWIFSGFDKIQ